MPSHQIFTLVMTNIFSRSAFLGNQGDTLLEVPHGEVLSKPCTVEMSFFVSNKGK